MTNKILKGIDSIAEDLVDDLSVAYQTLCKQENK